MTDQTTLDRMIADAEREEHIASLMLGAYGPSDPLRFKVAAKARWLKADAELHALRELVAEDPA